MEDYQPLVLQATAEGFLPGNLKVTVPADMESESMNIARLCLVPEPPKVNESFVVENVFYEYDKSLIKPESFPALDQIVRMMNTYPDLVIEISGHTDSKGSDIYNQRLSEARAQAVVAYLVSKGISKARLSSKGYGESKPVEPNENPNGTDNPEGREKNRRTEFKVIRN
jgi:outer membrane protein OmpA-like peptidoglycan-associated protein